MGCDLLRRIGITPFQIYAGSLWNNSYNERFNGTLGREVLNAAGFATTRQAQIAIDRWLNRLTSRRFAENLICRCRKG